MRAGHHLWNQISSSQDYRADEASQVWQNALKVAIIQSPNAPPSQIWIACVFSYDYDLIENASLNASVCFAILRIECFRVNHEFGEFG